MLLKNRDIVTEGTAHLPPRHVAIIMDGNRRWAKKAGNRNLSMGHWHGAKVIFDVVEMAKKLGIQVLTLWGFSTENWKRSKSEVALMMRIFKQYLQENRERMIQQGVKFSMIGDITPLSTSIKKEIKMTLEATSACQEIELVFAFNYGGKDDIRRAFVKIIDKIEKKELVKEEIDEATIARHLDTAEWPDPDLIIRTSAERRISNFFLWQLAYSEIYITDVLWPDFRPSHLVDAIMDYQQRQRRMGR